MFDKLIDLFVQFIRFFQFLKIVRDYQGGLVLRWGRFHRIIAPGMHWVYPFQIEESMVMSVVTETMLIGPQSLMSQDAVPLVVSVVVTFSVTDVRAALLEVWHHESALEAFTRGIVATEVKDHVWLDITREAFMPDVVRKVRARAKKFGVEIENVQVADLTRSRSIRLLQHAVQIVER